MYSKVFFCEITIYPDFHRYQYSGYIKEQFNKWILDCFRSYTAAFKIKVIQHENICYLYDSDTDRRDINTSKLWQNQFGTYTMFISGEGIIMRGAKPIEPPVKIVEELADKITFKYKESSDIEPPVMISYGKNIGLPLKYTRWNTEGEEWNSGFCEEDIYCPSWKIDICCTKQNFDESRKLIRELISLNSGESEEIETDPYGLFISVSAAFHLQNRNKVRYFSIINKLCDMVVNDDGITIEKLEMDFISSSDTFCLESYFYDEAKGKVTVKNISL